MKKIRKPLLKSIISFALVIALVMGAVPIDGLVMVAKATTFTSTINVGGTGYALFTGFTATGGNGTNYANLVDGNTSTDWRAQKTMESHDPDHPAPAGDFAGGTADDWYFVGWYTDAACTAGYEWNFDDHYTTSESERNNLVKAGWKDEGIAWYGMK